MRIYRKTQMLTIVALVIAIVTLGVGFAAFSTTLNISSSASVSPSSSDFSVGFYRSPSHTNNSSVLLFPSVSGGASAGNISLVGGVKSISNVHVTFTKPSEVVIYNFVVKNDGKFDAYLNSINLNKRGNCVAEGEATESLVQSACEGIGIAFLLDNYDVSPNEVVNIPIAQGQSLDVQLIIRYKEGSAYADGPFSVSFDPISIDFSSAEKEEELSDDFENDNIENDINDPFMNAPEISFYVRGVEYTAKQGMTWKDYIESDMNDVFFISNSYVKFMLTGFDSAFVYDSIIPVFDTDIIMSEYTYDWNYN